MMDETLLERLTDQIAANESPVDPHAKVDQLAASTVLLREVLTSAAETTQGVAGLALTALHKDFHRRIQPMITPRLNTPDRYDVLAVIGHANEAYREAIAGLAGQTAEAGRQGGLEPQTFQAGWDAALARQRWPYASEWEPQPPQEWEEAFAVLVRMRAEIAHG